MEYKDFLKTKIDYGFTAGLNHAVIHKKLFDYQKDIVKWSLRRGRCAVFADCGLGKTFIQLSFAQNLLTHIEKKVIIFAPLSVNEQTIQEAKLIDLKVTRYDEDDDCRIKIANYENLEKLNSTDYEGIVVDESSILKSVDSKTRMKLIEFARDIKYRMACTATPAPNDISEIANHTEFLGIMRREEMLSKWFYNNGKDWNLKGHAVDKFYEWMATWAMFMTKPSDLGYSDDGFKLPELSIKPLYLDFEFKKEDELFAMNLSGIQDRIKIRKESVEVKIKEIIKIIANDKDLCNNFSYEKQKSIHERIPIKKPLEMEADTSTAEESQQGQKIKIQRKHKIQGKNKSTSQKILEKESREEKESKIKTIQNNSGEIQGDSFVTKEQVPDMRVFGYDESVHIPNGRSLSQNKESERASLLELQSWDRKIQRQHTFIEKSNRIFENQWIVWCGIDLESDLLCKELSFINVPFVVVDGKTPTDLKLQRIEQFKNKKVHVLISKPKVLGFGMNFQNSHNMIFFGLSDSYEAYYQCIRRQYRFGQKNPVNVIICLAGNESVILNNVMHKEQESRKIADNVIQKIKRFEEIEMKGTKHMKVEYAKDLKETPNYKLYLGDSCEIMKDLESASMDFSVFSPPFASLYTYSNSDRDLGNSTNDKEFFEHFDFIIKELLRVIKPGRNVAVHCMNLPTKKIVDGFIGIRDFRGDIIRAFIKAGFIYHSEVTIDKNPQVAAIRTHAKGLMFKQMHKDSSHSRMGLADYICCFKRPGENEIPITPDLTNDEWITFAHPVWYDIRETDTLNSMKADKDEKHMCPLQLPVIERCIRLWSNKGDTVFSPFAGVGSEGYKAIQKNRKFIGIELKKEYFDQAVKNLNFIEGELTKEYLFA